LGAAPDRAHRPRSAIKALLAALAMAVGGVALAVFASAPSIISGAALTANPGPGMVASTSVAPSFVVGRKTTLSPVAPVPQNALHPASVQGPGPER
jgi:hypothetical protein